MTALIFTASQAFTNTAGLGSRKISVADNFVRADGPVDVASIGSRRRPWVTGVGASWAVVSNGARPSATSPNRQIITVDAGISDGKVSAGISFSISSSVGSGLVFRYVDPNNFLAILWRSSPDGWSLCKVVEGVSTVLRSSGVVAAAGDRLGVTLNGTAVAWTVNGVAQAGETVPEFVTATKHGLAALLTASSGLKFSDFSVGDV